MGTSNFYDRGRQFSGYFITKAEKPTKLFGVYWENAFPCGTFVNINGVTKGISFFIFFDDDDDKMIADKTGRHCEQLDLNLSETDALIEDPIIGDLIKEIPIPTEKKSTLYVDQKAIVESAFAEGFSKNRNMISRKLLQLMPEFLGKRFNQVLQNKPSVWQPTIDPQTGLEIPNIWRCNLGPDVNT